MSDYIIRGMAANNQVRFFACNSTDTVEKARITHNTSPVVTNALGRLLTAGALMGAMCKNDSMIAFFVNDGIRTLPSFKILLLV